MVGQLFEMSEAAKPTPFHHLLQLLDERGVLLRVYSQNIDAIEEKCGLSVGIPGCLQDQGGHNPVRGIFDLPRCIQLHGTLKSLYCPACSGLFPTRDHITSVIAGIPPHCPGCVSVAESRELAGMRSRGVGKLRPNIVLYQETHRHGAEIGEMVKKDVSEFKAHEEEVLLVFGTSLRVPGAQQIVRLFSNALYTGKKHCRSVCSETKIRSVYVNLDMQSRYEWEGVFDAWIQGDLQDFSGQVIDALR